MFGPSSSHAGSAGREESSPARTILRVSGNRSGQSQNLPQPFQPLLFCRGPGPIVEQRFQVAGCVHLADGVAQAAVRVQELDVRLGLLVVGDRDAAGPIGKVLGESKFQADGGFRPAWPRSTPPP